MKYRILLFGSKGQLGAELLPLLTSAADVVALSHQDVDLANQDAVRQAIRATTPQLIVNAAGYTAVDRAESEPDLAYAVNAAAPAAMAESALPLDAWFIHFSSDYVFDGSGNVPWREDDPTGPLNVYGRAKLAGEQAIAASRCRHLIFRTSWIYAAHGNNFLRTMLRLGAEKPALRIVNDQIGAPTSATEVAGAVTRIIARLQDPAVPSLQSGIYHMTCSGATSWFGFASAIFEKVKDRFPTPSLVAIPSAEYPTAAARPLHSVLDCGKLERETGIRLAEWQEALDRVIAELQVFNALRK
jgi:dTDP-4-dehydrorhamnose reductase